MRHRRLRGPQAAASSRPNPCVSGFDYRRAIFRPLIIVLMGAGIAALALGVPYTYAQSSVEGVPSTPDEPEGRALWSGIMEVWWTDVPGATSYELQWFLVSGWTDIPESVEVSFYGAGAVLKNVPPTISPTIRVRAVNSHGTSSWSDFGWVPQTDTPEAWRDVPQPTNVPATGRPTFSGIMETGV